MDDTMELVWRDSYLPPREKMVMSCIDALMDEDYVINTEEIAALTEMSVKAVEQAMQKLILAGYLDGEYI